MEGGAWDRRELRLIWESSMVKGAGDREEGGRVERDVDMVKGDGSDVCISFVFLEGLDAEEEDPFLCMKYSRSLRPSLKYVWENSPWLGSATVLWKSYRLSCLTKDW